MFDIPWGPCTLVQAPAIVSTRSNSRATINNIKIASVRSVGQFSDSELVLGLESFHPKTKSVAWGSLGLCDPPQREREKDIIIKFPNLFSFSFPSPHESKQHNSPQNPLDQDQEQVPQSALRAARSVNNSRLTSSCWRLKFAHRFLCPREWSTTAQQILRVPRAQVRIYLASPPSGSGSGTSRDRFFGFFSDATADPSCVDHSFPHLAGQGSSNSLLHRELLPSTGTVRCIRHA